MKKFINRTRRTTFCVSNVRRQGQETVLPLKVVGSGGKLHPTTQGSIAHQLPLSAQSLLADTQHPKDNAKGLSRNAKDSSSSVETSRVMGTFAQPCESRGSLFALLLEGATTEMPPGTGFPICSLFFIARNQEVCSDL